MTDSSGSSGPFRPGDTGASRQTVRATGAPARLPLAREPEQVLSQALRAMAGEPGGSAGTGTGERSAAPEFARWLLGAAAVGLVLGALLGLVTLL